MNKPKIIIYFDYEMEQGADTSYMSGGWGAEEYRNTKQLLDILDKYDIKVCFCTVGKIAEKNKLPYSSVDQIKEIHKRGHEISSHSYFHYNIANVSQFSFYYDLRESKRILEEAIGESIVTYTPPFNQPYNFMGISVLFKIFTVPLIRFRKRLHFPSFKHRLSKHYRLIRKAGFKIYREYDILKQHHSYYNKKRDLYINKLDCRAGFGHDTIEYIEKNIYAKNVLACYGHPHSLSLPGAQSFKVFEDFCKWLKQNKYKVILPKQLLIPTSFKSIR